VAEVLAFEEVVCAHDGPCASFLNCSLEGREIDLIESSVVDNCIIGVTSCFLVVEGIMLYADSYSVLLYFLDIRNAHLSGKERIFTHIFEVTAAERGSVDVHSRAEKDVLLTVACLFSDRFSVEG
jgi:hypothetical protein